MTPDFQMNLERGSAWSLPHFIPSKTSLSVTKTVKPAQFSFRPSAISFIRGKEDFFVSLTSNGSALFNSPQSQALPISKPHHLVIKILVSDSDVYLILLKRNQPFVRFYRINTDTLRLGTVRRERMFRNSRFQLQDLKKVDSSNPRIIIQHQNYLEVWDLQAEALILSIEGILHQNLWYSRDYILVSRVPGFLEVTQITSGRVDSVKIEGRVFHLEVIRRKLLIGTVDYPVKVVDLDSQDSYFIHHLPPTIMLETDLFLNGVLVFSDMTAKTIHNQDIQIDLTENHTLFADSKDRLAVLTNRKLYLISEDGDILSTFDVAFKNVTSVGMNEDTNEIYLGLKTGTIIIIS